MDRKSGSDGDEVITAGAKQQQPQQDRSLPPPYTTTPATPTVPRINVM